MLLDALYHLWPQAAKLRPNWFYVDIPVPSPPDSCWRGLADRDETSPIVGTLRGSLSSTCADPPSIASCTLVSDVELLASRQTVDLSSPPSCPWWRRHRPSAGLSTAFDLHVPDLSQDEMVLRRVLRSAAGGSLHSNSKRKKPARGIRPANGSPDNWRDRTRHRYSDVPDSQDLSRERRSARRPRPHSIFPPRS
jgi:hypothetical protein